MDNRLSHADWLSQFDSVPVYDFSVFTARCTQHRHNMLYPTEFSRCFLSWNAVDYYLNSKQNKKL